MPLIQQDWHPYTNTLAWDSGKSAGVKHLPTMMQTDSMHAISNRMHHHHGLKYPMKATCRLLVFRIPAREATY
ncbi:hypothetical protein BD410DRAFT_796413 [Rickenella mellea]|uniref:Uncharacterized protein n=1 Tax=Rickenella mellea TaxID=50990 RepID=A0A4Y7PJ08_9AGAM|nr:hypothetical protein BD410DRAFT_796413 [Rickenella mellea]